MAKTTPLMARGLIGAAAALALLLAASPSTMAAGRCEPDAGGGCARANGFPCLPSSDNPPAAGKCYTVKQERVLKCLCLATAPTSAGTPYSPLPGRPVPGTTSDGASTAACINKCDRAQIDCRFEAKTEVEMLKCGRIFQACEAECTAPHPH